MSGRACFSADVASVADKDIGGLAAFVAGLQPGERDKGLFWAACRAAQDGLDAAPLVTAAEQAGLPRQKAESTVASARRHIEKARADHEQVNS